MQMKEISLEMSIYDVIRRNIKRCRKEKGMTSAQLAEAVGLSHDFIRQIESEKTRNNFSVETFYKISLALGVSMDTLADASVKDPQGNDERQVRHDAHVP